MTNFDAFIIGAGPGGEVVAGRLSAAGLNVALAEMELLGGECGTWACVPSKTLLRPVEIVAEARRGFGVGTPEVDWPKVRDYRDYMIRNLDDTDEQKSYADDGVTVFKSRARLAGEGKVEVGGETHEAKHIVIATGTEPVIPPIDGLEQAGYWTNRDATTFKDVPESAVVLGGGPVGIELGQMLARYGTRVSIVEAADRILAREDPQVSEQLAASLEEDGVEIHTGSQAVKVERADGVRRVTLEDGNTVEGAELVVAVGRKPRVQDLGLDQAGVPYDEKKGIEIDDRCRAADGVYAIGDVTGVLQFTHVAKYQGRLVASEITGKGLPAADYSAIPRVVFSDPEVAAVGLTEAQAREQGVDLVTHELELSGVGRSHTYEENPRGMLRILADRDKRTLVGAWGVGPMAGEWIHLAVLAIKMGTTIDVLRDTILQFPSYSEAFGFAVERLGL